MTNNNLSRIEVLYTSDDLVDKTLDRTKLAYKYNSLKHTVLKC